MAKINEHPLHYTKYYKLWVCPTHATAYLSYSGDSHDPNASAPPPMCCPATKNNALAGLHGEKKHAEIRQWASRPRLAARVQVEAGKACIQLGSALGFTEVVPEFTALAGNFFDEGGQQGAVPPVLEDCLLRWLYGSTTRVARQTSSDSDSMSLNFD
jgi:hypothetical protein